MTRNTWEFSYIDTKQMKKNSKDRKINLLISWNLFPSFRVTLISI